MLFFSLFSVLVVAAFSNAAFLLPDPSIIFKQCVGPACPTFSWPMKTERPGSHHPMNCSKGDYVPDPLECQSFYVCNRDGNGVKMMCTFGYAFHPRIKQCVPESLVKSCGKVYCPPSILIGTVSDPLNCTQYYRCVYGTTMHYQCEPEHVYDQELGKCWAYGETVPTCISGENNLVENTTEIFLTTSTSSPVPEVTTEQIITTTTTTAVPDLSIAEVITEEPISVPTTSDTLTSTVLTV